MYYPDDDTLVIDRKDITWLTDDQSDTASQESSIRRYKGYCSGRLNPDLLLCKIFYFAFYGSYGCLYPLIAIYFKQLGLDATQSGILVGIRPFVEFCAAPMWGAVADTWRKAKAILLFSIFSWLVFTEAVAFVHQAPSTCVVLNSTLNEKTPIIVVTGSKSEPKVSVTNVKIANESNKPGKPVKASGNETNKVLSKSYTLNNTIQRNPREANDTSSNSKKVIVIPDPNVGVQVSNGTIPKMAKDRGKEITVIKYKSEDTRFIFIYLLLLMVLGEFFSSPTITLADSATLGYLGHQRMDMYGRQRMFGSLSWGLFMFVEGLILDRTMTTTVECDGQITVQEENYLVCFGTYAVLITCAFFVAAQFQFKYRSLNDTILSKNSVSKASRLREAHGRGSSEVIRLNSETNEATKPTQRIDSETREDEVETNYAEVLKMYATVRYGTVLYVVWFAGFGFGFLFTFLYWHLKDLGGPPYLFGIASIVNHLSEVTGYFFSGWFIRKIGHIPMLCLGLSCYAIRCIATSYLVNPWWVLFVETLQGVTHAFVWAASTSFIGICTSQKNRSSAQGILQGVYHGLGRGCGAIFGGIIITAYGSEIAFRSIGVAYVIVMLLFAVIQYLEDYDKREEKQEDDHNYTTDEEPLNVESNAAERVTALRHTDGSKDYSDSSLTSNYLNVTDDTADDVTDDVTDDTTDDVTDNASDGPMDEDIDDSSSDKESSRRLDLQIE